VASPVIGGVNTLGLVQELVQKPPKTSTIAKSLQKQPKTQETPIKHKNTISRLEGEPKTFKKA